MKIKVPSIAKGCVPPYSVQEKIAKEDQVKKERIKCFWRDLIIAIVSALIGNIDRIIGFISNLI